MKTIEYRALMEIVDNGGKLEQKAYDEVLAYARSTLTNAPAPQPGGEEAPGLADNFGYNQGYMLEILAAPPEGVEANSDYEIDCPDALFDCSYATSRLAVLEQLAGVQADVASGAGGYGELASELLPLQRAAIPHGRSVWSSGLSVQGFSQDSYDQLLDVSSSFLETVQATGLTMARAAVEGDAEQARIGSVANAAMIVWLDAYRAGLVNGEGAIQLPTFG